MRRDGCRDSSGCRARSNRVRSRWKRCLENVAGQKNAYAFGSLRDHLTTFDDACGNKAVCDRLAAPSHGLAFDSFLCLPMACACALFLRRVAAWTAGGGCPHTNERSRRECPTHTSLLIKPVCSSSLDDGGRELQQRRCGRAALLGPHSGAHERWPSGPVHG